MPEASALMTLASVRESTNAVSPDTVLERRITSADEAIRRFRGSAHPTGSTQADLDELTRRRQWLVALVLADEDNALEPDPIKHTRAKSIVHRQMVW